MKESKMLYYTPVKLLLYLVSGLTLLRSVFRGISDYDSYRTAGILIFNEIQGLDSRLAYDPNWGSFGSRSGNGPIWNIFLAPFQLLPFTPAIIIVRLIVILVAITLVMYFVNKYRVEKEKFNILFFILLLFPFRFLFNTSQGASISYAIGCLAIMLSLKSKLYLYHYILIGFSLTLCLNYKPHLFLPLIVWFLANRKFKILLSVLLSGLMSELLLILVAPNSTQIAWGYYLLARSKSIDANSELELKYAPLAFFYDSLNANTFMIYIISGLFLLLYFIYFSKLEFKFETGIIALCLGVFIGPYSPTHDQIMLAVVYGIVLFNNTRSKKLSIFWLIPLILWIYPSEFTILKFIILVLLYNLILVPFFTKSLIYRFNALLFVITVVVYKYLSTDVIYQITGLAALFILPLLKQFYSLNRQIKNL